MPASKIKIGLLASVSVAAAVACFGVRPAIAANEPKVQCGDLAKLTFEGNTTITAATVVSGKLTVPTNQTLTDLPEFCRIEGVSKPTADSNITFEVWLPTKTWNGKFLSSGEGGFAGVPNYTRLGLDGGLDMLVSRNYATASTDTGHSASDQFWAIGHPERVIDYAYRSKHLVTVAAKGLITAFYGKAPDFSYFNSCSNGGRQGLLEMELYPNDYDGVVVGSPWVYQSHANATYVWAAQAVSAPSAAIPAKKLPAIQAAALAACDKIDGIADGIIDDPRKCNFDPATLLCTTGDNDNCLTQAQIDALRKLYAGPSNPRTGEKIYPGWTPGSETGWTAGIIGATTGAGPLNLGMGYFGNLVFEDPKWTFDKLNFDGDIAKADAKIGAIADANNKPLIAAKARGVKVIMYHGWNDQTITPGYTPQYFEKVASENGGMAATQDFMRLFMVPGMMHCYFGPGASSFGGVGQQVPPARDPAHDVQSALEAWVEKGVAPASIVATKYMDDAATTRTIKSTRLLCPYPQTAKYKGAGDQTDAANFQCGSP